MRRVVLCRINEPPSGVWRAYTNVRHQPPLQAAFSSGATVGVPTLTVQMTGAILEDPEKP